MAAVAIAGTTGIVHPGAAHKGRGGMAMIAIQRSCYVVVIFTPCCDAMAGLAIAHNAGMVKYGPDETLGVMADATILVGNNVAAWFALGETCTMTG